MITKSSKWRTSGRSKMEMQSQAIEETTDEERRLLAEQV